MATKFISPFLSDETEGEVADEGDLTTSDALFFNDSLDEGVDPITLLDDAVLPMEHAAAEPKPGNLPQKKLNDSLNAEDLDEAQLPGSDGDLTQAAVEEAAASVELKAVTPQPDSSKGQRKLTPKVSSSSSVEKKTNANLEEKKVASTTEPQASKAMAKVKPSFGKKKKGFTPPNMIMKAAPTTTDQSKSNTQPEKASDQNSSNASDKSPPQNSPGKVAYSTKQQLPNDTGSEVKTTLEKMPSTEEKKAKVPDKKMSAEEKKREKEKKEQERALKKQALEQKKMEREKKKAELERQRNEKRLELEQKKTEREQKKMEKELKKMEREQKKVEKHQVKASQKKQQTEDKKTEDTSSSEESIKKDEIEPSSEKSMEDKSQHETDVMKSGELETDKVKKNIPPVGEKQSSVMSMKDAAAGLSPVASCDDKTKKQKEKFSPQKKGCDLQKTSGADIKDKENNEPQNGDASAHEELAKDTTAAASPATSKSTEVSGNGTTKQKEKKVKKFSPPKSKKDAHKAIKKQRKPVIKSRIEKSSVAGDDVNKKTQAGKGKKRKLSVYSDSEDELEPKRAKPAEHISSVWVQCENASCKKWRLLRECDDPAKVPGKWVCSMNTDPDHNSCSAEEEQWSDLGDSQEFVESPFIPGSLVWSKMDGYPWWPAMIEEDPNKETYYEMGYRDNPVPVRYHVVFFDTPVSRGWVSSLHTLPYTGQNDPNKDGNVNVPQRLKRTLTEGKKQANKALGLSIKERLETLGFAKRFHGYRRKRQAEDSPEAIPSQSKYRKTTSSGERKSVRLRVSVEEEVIPVVSLKPLQIQQPDNEKSVDTNVKESGDNSSMQQREE